jgi:hypothetical protein
MVSMLPTLTEGFTNASLRGSYAVYSIGQGGRAESASLGALSFDGNGRVTGSTTTNLPGSSGSMKARTTSSRFPYSQLRQNCQKWTSATGIVQKRYASLAARNHPPDALSKNRHQCPLRHLPACPWFPRSRIYVTRS